MAERIIARRVPRRRFLGAAGGAAAAIAMPQVSRAQSSVWRVQSAWPARDIFHEFAIDYGRKVEAISGGRLRFDVLPSGSVVPAFQLQDAVHAGILDGGHGICDIWYRKHKAFPLFSSPPPFGWNAHGVLGWYYHGGGEALYRELVNDILKLNVTGLLYFPMPVQPLGWFRKPLAGAGADLKGISYRAEGLASEMFKALGASVVTLPTGDIVQTMDRGLLDAAGLNNPSSDLQLGLADVAKVYMMGSHHRPAGTLELIFNKGKYDALPAELQAVLRYAALAASTEQLGMAYLRYAADLGEIRRRGVSVVRTGEALMRAELDAWDQVIADHSKEPFFARVIASQKTWVRRVEPYLQINDLNSAELVAAYRRLVGDG